MWCSSQMSVSENMGVPVVCASRVVEVAVADRAGTWGLVGGSMVVTVGERPPTTRGRRYQRA